MVGFGGGWGSLSALCIGQDAGGRDEEAEAEEAPEEGMAGWSDGIAGITASRPAAIDVEPMFQRIVGAVCEVGTGG